MINLQKARDAKRNKQLAKQQNYYFQKARLIKKWKASKLLDIEINKESEQYEARLVEALQVQGKTSILMMVFKINNKHYYTTRDAFESRVQNLAENLLDLHMLTEEDCDKSISELLNKYCLDHIYSICVFAHSKKGKNHTHWKTCTIEHFSEDFEFEKNNKEPMEQKKQELNNGIQFDEHDDSDDFFKKIRESEGN